MSREVIGQIFVLVAMAGLFGAYGGFWLAWRMKARRLLASKRIDDLAEFVQALGLAEISRQADPGNEQCDLVLFDAPSGITRILVMADASDDANGDRSTYWLEVPRESRTAIEAVAWTFGLSATDYARLERAS